MLIFDRTIASDVTNNIIWGGSIIKDVESYEIKQKYTGMEQLQIEKMLEEKGFIDEPIDSKLKLVEEINRLKKEKNASVYSFSSANLSVWERN